MSLRDTIAKGVANAFKALDDIPETATYRRTTTVYDPQTGTSTTTTEDLSPQVIFTSYQNFEIDRVAVLSTDVKAIIQQAALSDFTPTAATDQIIRFNGETFNVLRYSADPAGATFSIQLRAP